MSLSFLLTSLIVCLAPGTGVLYTLAVALSRGSRASVAAAFGCTLGIHARTCRGAAHQRARLFRAEMVRRGLPALHGLAVPARARRTCRRRTDRRGKAAPGGHDR